MIDTDAVWLSVRLAAATATVLLVLGTPLAWWIAHTRRRWRPLVEALVAVPLVLPPTVLGFYLLVAMGPNGPLGALWEGATGGRLAFSFEALLVASVISSLPFAVQPLAVAFAAVDRSLLEASWTLGRSGPATFARVVAPLSLGGFLTAVVLAFAHTIGEFGVVLMVGGNIPGETRTVAIAIYDRVQALDYAGAAATALPLLVFSFVVLALTYGLRGGGSGVAPWVARR
jgi:molybdate transport system permease protein